MKLRALRYTLLLVALFGISFLLWASLPSVPTGTWVATGNMSAARAGACTVALSDGRLLISGGADANGPTATADLFSTTGSWSAAASMNSPRSHQSCAVLPDGRVLVAGGTTSGGGITNAAEMYDPSADSWAQAGVMNDARSGATASVLQDGRVLIAGGQSSGGALNTLEIFDPNSGNCSNAGTMSSPRQDHAAAVLSDGRVLIVGGSSDGANALNTTEIYDPHAGSVSAGPAMSTARAQHTATTLLDGAVVVIGGSDYTNDLASAEFFDPAANNFNAASSLVTARSKHSAFLLPKNNEVLVVGGQSAGTDLNSAELYIPWQKAFQATGAMATPRSYATGAALTQVDGRLLMAGGSDASGNALASTELYAFSTVKTDLADYAPGSIVTITGSGWKPGETVNLTFRELPNIDTPGPYTTVADGNGNIVDTEFAPDINDLDVRFYLTAVGQTSAFQAQNTFTDAKSLKITAFAFTAPDPGATDGTVDTNQTPITLSVTIHDQTGSTGVSWTNVAASLSVPTGWTTSTLNLTGGTIAANGSLTYSWTVTAPASAATNSQFSVSVSGTPSGGCGGSDKCTDTATYKASAVTPASISISSMTASPSSANAGSTVSVAMVVANSGDAAALNVQPSALTLNATGSPAPNASCTTPAAAKVNPHANTTFTYTCSSLAGAGTLSFTASASGTDENTGATVSTSSGTSNSINVDAVPPTVSITSNPPNPTNSTSASFAFTGTDNITPTASLTYNCKLDGGGFSACTSPKVYSGLSYASHTFQVESVDQAGNVSTPASYTWTVVQDNTPPVVMVSFLPAPDGQNGWYVHSPVTGTVTADDTNTGGSNVTAISCTGATVGTITNLGTKTASAPLTISADGTYNVSCTATDSAGNPGASAGSTAMPVAVKIDTTPPTITFVSRTAANSNGWNNTDVTVNWSCTDSLSGPVSASVSKTVSSEGPNQSSTGTCQDNAGNSASNTQSGINIDKTPPTLTITPDHAANANGWYNSTVKFAVNGNDTGSGIASCTTVSDYSGPDNSSASVSASCTDKAGNTGSATFNFKYDATAPTITFVSRTAANGAGWNNTDVTVNWSCADSLSGPVSANVSQTVSSEGPNQSSTGTCQDNAGNSASNTQSGINIDKTPPTITYNRTPANSYGWNNTTVTVSFSCSDSLSGLAVGSPPAPTTLTAEGANQSVTGTCKDIADNSASTMVTNINIDKTPPTISVALDRALAGTGWFNLSTGRPTGHFTCSDSLSGLDNSGCPADQGPLPDGGNQTVSGTVTDKAGNSASASILHINVDVTPPTITITAPSNNGSYLLNQAVAVASNYSCTDATSGVATCAGTVASGANFSTNPVAGHSFTVNATDVAGNTATLTNNYTVTYATAGGICLGDLGHTILQPINADGSSVFNGKSTSPAKFRVCDANGISIGTAGVVSNFVIYQVVGGTVVPTVDEQVFSTTPDTAFRWDPTGLQWIFNINNKSYPSNQTYFFRISLNDGTSIYFNYGLK